MDIPAYMSPILCLGRSFDKETSTARADVFPSIANLPTQLHNINKFSFKYQVVKSSKDVNDLLDISGELSLKIKANLLKVEGAGQYLNETKTEEETTNLLAVMKCTTVVETINGAVKPRDDVGSDAFGTHYVRSVTYGVEMVASLKFKCSSNSTKENIKGKAEGQLKAGAVDAGLKASLNKLSSECNDVSDISIKYYATDLPDKLPTTLGELVSLIESFPSRLKSINDGKGIPMLFELQPLNNIIPTEKAQLPEKVLSPYEIEKLESHFDDLRNAKGLSEAYLDLQQGEDDDVDQFNSETKRLYGEFRQAIETMNKSEGPEKVEACLQAYKKAFDERDREGKFVRQWKKILSTKESTVNPGRKTSREMKEKKDVNILILGETGVGKSTWINGIANYFRHESLQAAMENPKFTCLIPSRFSFTNDEGEEIDISFGSDENEVFVTGQSATQFPQEYTFETDTVKFHLIDTPGIGDSRGIDQDKENFGNTLDFLTCFDKINAVVVLLKPNNARLTVAFKFCVLELLTHLHKSLVSNIIFAFTNSRGTFYRPGDTLPALKKLLQDKKITIDVSRSNYFCFDNEAFRFLACQKKGIEFTTKEIDLFSESWVQSCDTTDKLFQRVMQIPPHETKKTLSLNEARNYILALSKPMGEAVDLINRNLNAIKVQRKECKAVDATIESFQAKLKFKGFGLEIQQLDYPITVCADENCKRYENIGESGEKNTIYHQICHDHCYLPGIPVETTNNEQLRRCRAMSDGKCTKCGHNFTFHMHITYKTTVVEKEFLSEETQKMIMKEKDHKSQKEAFIKELEKKIKKLEEEKDYIYDCASHFGIFLKENALIPYNDSFSDYLDMLIREEETKEKEIRDDKKIEKMKKEKKTYEEKKKVIMSKTASSARSVVIRPEEIYKMKDKLCALKHNGESLKNALDGVMSGRQKIHKEDSKHRSSTVKATTSKSWLSRATAYVMGKN